KALLQQLHDDWVQYFIASPGFGVMRMPMPASELPTRWTLDKDLDHGGQSIPQPSPLPGALYPEDDLRQALNVKTEFLRSMHLSSVIDFANPSGFGLVISRQKVAGFQSHHFSTTPVVGMGYQDVEWKVQTVELIGLLIHDGPVVYISQELPRMEK